MRNLKILYIALIVSVSFGNTALLADVIFDYRGFAIGGGISTVKLLGENPAKLPIIQTDTTKEGIYGGSFQAVAPGLELRGTMYFGEDEFLRIPVGLSWTSYSSGERFPISALMTVNYWHSVQNLALRTGAQLVLYKLDWANAKLYSGLDLDLNYIFNGEITYKERYIEFPQRNLKIVRKTKDNTFRLGSNLRLGVEGDLIKKWQVNTSVAVGAMNLIGRDKKRGELLTPFTFFEETEQMLYTFNVSVMVQYKF